MCVCGGGGGGAWRRGAWIETRDGGRTGGRGEEKVGSSAGKPECDARRFCSKFTGFMTIPLIIKYSTALVCSLSFF